MCSELTFLRYVNDYGAIYDIDYSCLQGYNRLLGKNGENLN